jgi:hypothetical protein
MPAAVLRAWDLQRHVRPSQRRTSVSSFPEENAMIPSTSRPRAIVGPALLWTLAIGSDLLPWPQRLSAAALLAGVVWAALGALPALLDSRLHAGRKALGLMPRRLQWPISVTAAFGGVLALRSLLGPDDPRYLAAAGGALLGVAVAARWMRPAGQRHGTRWPAVARWLDPDPILGRRPALSR